MTQVFDAEQKHAMARGDIAYQTLINQIREALFNNQFNSNYILSSMPGLGKSHGMGEELKNITGPKPILINGSSSMSAFTIDMATAVYLAGGKPLVVVLDDCDMLLESANINITKKMFDQTRQLAYNKNFKALGHLCNEVQMAAMQSFSTPDRAGFSVPTNNVTFIILTNRHLPTENEVNQEKPGTKKATYFTDLLAIRRRTQYKEISMSTNDLWGYVANITITSNVCEKILPTITQQQKEQILTWCHARWEKVTERNLSLIEKMTMDMVRYTKNYLDIWAINYL